MPVTTNYLVSSLLVTNQDKTNWRMPLIADDIKISYKYKNVLQA